MADMLVRYFDNGCNVLIVKAVKHMLAVSASLNYVVRLLERKMMRHG